MHVIPISYDIAHTVIIIICTTHTRVVARGARTRRRGWAAWSTATETCTRANGSATSATVSDCDCDCEWKEYIGVKVELLVSVPLRICDN